MKNSGLPDLTGKTALISGGARGIGAACARLMAQAGACVLIGDILEEEGNALCGEITANGGTCHFVPLDVRTEAAWKDAVALAVAQFGGLDILVNNAGIYLGADIETVELDAWQRMVNINLTGVFLGTRVCAPALRVSGKTSAHGSAIVNVSSVAGLVGAVGDPLYSMTKGGVTLFTKSTALSFAQKGDRIRVNSVHPGVIETDMGDQTISGQARRSGVSTENARTLAKKIHPIGRMGRIEEVAHSIVFLASDNASFTTGTGLVIDGGLTA